jgi:hypothetical protein
MRFLIQLFFAALIVASGMFGGFMYYRIGKVSMDFFEKNPPKAELAQTLVGVGFEPKNVTINLSDEQSGLDQIIVRVAQENLSPIILKQDFTIDTKDKSVSVTINAKELGLKEGSSELQIAAFDRSFQVNSTHLSIPFKVRYGKPRVASITPQHNISVGGMELVFYKTKNTFSSGVQVGAAYFPGYSASLLDDRFVKYPDINFAFFALPYNYDRAKDKVTLVAKDEVGNVSTATFPFLPITRKFKQVDIKLSDSFLQKVFPEILPAYFESINQPYEKKYEDVESLSTEEKIYGFKLINESYRNSLLNKLQKLLENTEQKRLSDWEWIRPMNAAPTSAFCESRTYLYDGQNASASLHAGVDLADTRNAAVRAANSGKVIFADDFGIYGSTVIIDHGFGMSTLYGHLSSIDVSVADTVQKNQVIGKSGISGLAAGDHLHFELRLHNVPVYPIEWWDYTWVKAHIVDKIDVTFAQLESE